MFNIETRRRVREVRELSARIEARTFRGAEGVSDFRATEVVVWSTIDATLSPSLNGKVFVRLNGDHVRKDGQISLRRGALSEIQVFLDHSDLGLPWIIHEDEYAAIRAIAEEAVDAFEETDWSGVEA